MLFFYQRKNVKTREIFFESEAIRVSKMRMLRLKPNFSFCICTKKTIYTPKPGGFLDDSNLLDDHADRRQQNKDGSDGQ